MPRTSLEDTVVRLFATPQALPDATDFAARVEARLSRGWRRRRLMIGAAGALGGVIAAAQVLQANLVERASTVGRSADAQLHDVAGAALERGTALLHAIAPGVSGEVVWMVAGLGAVGLALAAARVLEAF